MRLNHLFDSVIMLTMSDWHTEPRSNRHHYATRFAKELPVYFVQNNWPGGFDELWEEFGDLDKVTIEPSGTSDVSLVRLSWKLFKPVSRQAVDDTDYASDPATFDGVKRFFSGLGCKRPLIWIYDPFSYDLANNLDASFKLYHATENYLYRGDLEIGGVWNEVQEILREGTENLLKLVDLTVAVSDGVYKTITSANVASGSVELVENGNDADFWLDKKSYEFVPTESQLPVVLYQGGVNRRLDFELIHEVVLSMPDWDFWFCGIEDESIDSWRMIKRHPNVKYHGKLTVAGVAELSKRATVGWIPFVDSEVLSTSMPLKSYEYLACGLPVVSTPITGLLGKDQRLFQFGRSSREHETLIRQVAPSRSEPEVLALRKKTALENSNEQRFQMVTRKIAENIGHISPKKNILVCYDEKYNYINTVDEHLTSFKKYSKNNIFYVPVVVGGGPLTVPQVFIDDPAADLFDGVNGQWDFNKYDVIIIHYAVRLAFEGYLLKTMEDKISRSSALKILFIQDEYDTTNIAKDYIKRLKIDVVYTCVPEDGRDKVYPRAELPKVDFVQTLTGFVPDAEGVEEEALPLKDRATVIGYRGRKLSHQYGQLGYEKYIIGERMREEAESRGLSVDISNAPEDRIYGSWYQFVGSCRATLGTESGANLFDFDGSLKELAERLEDKPFEQVYEEHFARYDNLVQMNQISPKFFEAARLRTALICFRGYYSDIIHPDTHYIPLEKDFSNVDEVFEKVLDDDLVEALTERTYRDLISSGKYSYKSFIREFDDWLDGRIPYSTSEIISMPVAVRTAKGITPIHIGDLRDKVLNTAVLRNDQWNKDFSELLKPPDPPDEEEMLRRQQAIAGGVASASPADAEANQVSVEVDSLSDLATKEGQFEWVTAIASPTRVSLLSEKNALGGKKHFIQRITPRVFRQWIRSKAIHASLISASSNHPLYFKMIRFGWRYFTPKRLKTFIGRKVFG